MRIHQDMKMAEVIHLNHHLLHVINRFGIQLGFAEKTVAEVCEQYHVPLSFFLEIVNTFHDPTYFPIENLKAFKASMLINYLQKTHQYYLEYKIPEIEHFIKILNANLSIGDDIKMLLANFFGQYKSELTAHINKEEQRVYPYILALEHFIESGQGKQELIVKMKEYSIHEYEEDHDDVESKLFDLKNIIIKYIPQPKDSRDLNVILHELFELEKDLHNHGHIEDLILVPIVERMELEVSAQHKELLR